MQDPVLQIKELSEVEHEVGMRLALKELEEAQFRVQAEAFCDAATSAWPSRVRVWGAFRQGNLTGSLLVQVQPGRSAMLWPPRVAVGEPREIAQGLMDTAIRALSQSDLRLVQALLPTDVGEDVDILTAAGFRHFSDLLYLVCPDSGFPSSPLASPVEFLAVGPEHEQRLARLIESTYVDTRDCPAVNDLRSIDDVLLGYRATGKYDSQGWLFVRHRGEDIGCLILADHPRHSTRELIYMGLAPTARRRGFGTAVIRHALCLTAEAKRQRLVLAVDAANEPALRMYAAAGFQAWDRKSVFIRVMP
jgi:ribosomal protein S18 acetylase RimI-like enzyme